MVTIVIKRSIGLLFAALSIALPTQATAEVFCASIVEQAKVGRLKSALGCVNEAAKLTATGANMALKYKRPLADQHTDQHTRSSFLETAVSGTHFSQWVVAFSDWVVSVDRGNVRKPQEISSSSSAPVSFPGRSLLRFQSSASINTAGFLPDSAGDEKASSEPVRWAVLMLGFSVLAFGMKKFKNKNKVRENEKPAILRPSI